MDPLLIVMVAVLALFIFFQFRNSKKRRAEQEKLQSKMVPGAEIMTQFGLYGTLLSIDEESNEALVETTPGTVLRVHRQTILKVVEDDAVEAEDTTDSVELDDDSEPAFGERVDKADSADDDGADKRDS
ncbi:preprotein translocase subunit YajC [Homoserinimonas aerilata]|uniref:Preprotein translocase subunit YajC n=1 Tax=Homoserinimonas aerilata TaxID=1162970 RepID=A0A542YIN4_9MICO|nr:preprotein translocase subunit YajC [Homoserinimonas aerilata]TQL47948.1 preprotein translocase subunit YajC [Homoserinimonas aerilata]